MNQVSLAIATLFGVLSAVFLVLLVVAIVQNLRTGIRFRESLARQLSALRLNRMLAILGIDRSTYLHEQPVVKIREQMERCTACTRTDECDSLPDDDAGEDIGFCPNEASLREARKRLGAASRQAAGD